MKMYEKLHDFLFKSELLNGVIVQYLQWRDKEQDKVYMVFRPNGGSQLSGSLGNEYLVLVDFIAPDNDPELINNLVYDVADYIKLNQFNECLGNIQIVGNIPAPVTTTDNRLVYRLIVSVKHGN